MRRYRYFAIYGGAMLLALGLFAWGKQSRPVMNFLVAHVTGPVQRALAWLCNPLPFSVSALVIAAAILAVVGLLANTVWRLARRPHRLRTLLTRLCLFGCIGLTIGTGMTTLWGVNYYADSFEEQSGLRAAPVSVEELARVTAYFADNASRTAAPLPRGEDGTARLDRAELFREASGLYTNLVREYPFLDGPDFRPKPFLFSEALSYLNVTGFYFPFTGEANLNNNAPVCFLPATIAHELAHQRGVAPEQEANFVGILACLTSGKPAFEYSGWLLGYFYLGNALYSADRERWAAAGARLSEAAWADLEDNNRYWDRYHTVIAEVSGGINDSMLKGYGQELGVKSYGAVVDLLVAHYRDRAP